MTHTNGTGAWTCSVNGSPVNVTLDGDSGLSGYLGAQGGLWFKNANYPSTVYLDAVPVPEPSSMVLLTASLMGLLAYAWRKRK